MTQKVKLEDESSPTSTASLTGNIHSVGKNNALAAAGYRWFKPKPVGIPNTISIDDFYGQLKAEFPGFEEGVREATKKLADTYYSGEVSLRTLRLKKGLSQTELAELAGWHQPFLARIESGKTSPTIDTVSRLAKALDIDPGHLTNILLGAAKSDG